MKCKSEKDHGEHLCQLKLNQQFDKVRELTQNAGYFCANCEAQAKEQSALCMPKPFKGKPGILKWK